MTARYLFRLDGSRENDEFFEMRRKEGIDVAYSGTPLKIGPGWIPDLVEVATDAKTHSATITLIELEASEIVAKASARKYLPESSAAIAEGFAGYLRTVIAQCRQTADSRTETFQRLMQFLADGSSLAVRTAAALRTASSFIEDLPLIDQPSGITISPSSQTLARPAFLFDGERPLSRIEVNGVIRVIRLFDAVILDRDISSGTLRSWRNLRVKRLNHAVEEVHQSYPGLWRLLSEKADHGLRLDCDRICDELTKLWSSGKKYRIAPNDIAAAIASFYPLAIAFQEFEPMHRVFGEAQAVLKKWAI